MKMKKLQEINLLVEEAINLLDFKDTNCWKDILTTLARKCAEINEEDFDYYSRKILYYNSRLRDGQVETPETKQEEVKEQTKTPSSKYYPLFQYLHDEFNIILLETDCQEIERLLNSQPREWWMDLKEGDKFIFDNKADRIDLTFDGTLELYKGSLFLKSEERGSTAFRLDYCSPYTDPAQSFRSKLTPEMQVEFDKIVSSLTPNTPQP